MRKHATIQPKLISVVDNVFQHLHFRVTRNLHTAKDDALAEKVASVFHFIFQHYSAFLRPRFDQFTQTLVSISALALKFLDRQVADGANGKTSQLVHSFLQVLFTALKVYRQLCIDAAMQNKVFTTVVEDLLSPFLGILAISSKLLPASSNMEEASRMMIKQVVALIEKTLQHALFGSAQMDEFNAAFASSIVYGQDNFLHVSSKKRPLGSQNESGAPMAKRAKNGAASDLSPQYPSVTSTSEVSKSYAKKLFDWLEKACNGSDENASNAVAALPNLFRLCVANIFSSRGRFATSDHSQGSSSSTAMTTPQEERTGLEDENDGFSSAGDSAASLSQKTVRVLWCMFAALQRISMTCIRRETSSGGRNAKSNSSNAILRSAIVSNTALLSIVREYDLYSHSQVGIADRAQYLALHVKECVQLSTASPDLDVLFGSLRLLLELDQTFIEEYIGQLLRIVWSQPIKNQFFADSFCAALLSVYGLLRQLDVLLTRILEQLSASPPLVGFFGAQFWTSFATNVELLPTGLIVPIYHLFLDDLRKNYIQHKGEMNGNVVHAEALFNNFLENLKLSPSLATQLCQGLDATVKDICGPLLNTFLKDVANQSTHEMTKKYATGVPQHVQAGIALYSIFVTFENYCRNRFFPSHNTPEDVDLALEGAPHFSKLSVNLGLDKVCDAVKAIEAIGAKKAEKGHNETEKSPHFWRFQAILFSSALQRAVKLYKLIAAVPPANLPSLVQRHKQVANLKSSAQLELDALLPFLASQQARFEAFLRTMTKVHRKHQKESHSRAANPNAIKRGQNHTVWHVNSLETYYIYVWDSMCVNSAFYLSETNDTGASSFLNLLVSTYLLSPNDASSTPSTTSLPNSLVPQMDEASEKEAAQASHFIASVKHSSALCWLSAPFYEMHGVRHHLIGEIIQQLRNTCSATLDSNATAISDLFSSKHLLEKAHKVLSGTTVSKKWKSEEDDTIERLSLLASLPANLWTSSDIQNASSTLIVLLLAFLKSPKTQNMALALAVSLRNVILKSWICLPSTGASSSFSQLTEIMRSLFDPSALISILLEPLYRAAPFECAELFSALCQVFTANHAIDSKSAKFLKTTTDLLLEGIDSEATQDHENTYKFHLLQAALHGVYSASHLLDHRATTHADWVKQTQRNNVGWKAPSLQSVIYHATLQKILSTLGKRFKSLIRNLMKADDGGSKDAEDLTLAVIAFRALYSLVDIARLQKSKFAQFLDKKGVSKARSEMALDVPEKLFVDFYLRTLDRQFFETMQSSTESAMEVDAEPSGIGAKAMRDEICFASFVSLLRSLPLALTHMSENDFGDICSMLYRLLIDASFGERALHLVKTMVPTLAPFHCRFLLSFLMYELHKITSRETTYMTLPAWAVGSQERMDSRVAILFVLLRSLGVILPLIDPSVAYDVMSQYSSKLIITLCSLVESSLWPTLDLPLASNAHVLIVNLLTQLIGDKFVEISGAELAATASLLGAVAAKQKNFAAAPLLLQLNKNDQNLAVPLGTWASIVSFTPELFTAYYHLLSTTLHSRPLQVSKNLSTLLLNAKILLYTVAIRTSPSHQTATEQGDGKMALKKIHAEYVGRLYQDLAALGPHMRTFAVHMLVDFIVLVEREPLAPYARAALNPGIYSLVALLEENEQNLILKALDATGKAIFRQIHQEYERDWKYQGKA